MKKLLFAVLFMSAASLALAQDSTTDSKKWELQAQGGLSIPVSPYFANGNPLDYPGDGYKTGYNYGGAIGYKITPQLSVLADLEWHEFDSKYTYSGRTYFWNTTEVALLLKYRFLNGPFTPFVFAGPGIALNAVGYSEPDAPYSRYSYETNETDALLQLGVGAEYAVTDDFSVFAQVKESIDFTGGFLSDWTPYAPDIPTRYVPVEAGVIVNL
jgi:opacity protein-like surface antigen